MKTNTAYYLPPRLAPGLRRYDLSLVYLCLQMIGMGKTARLSTALGGTRSYSDRPSSTMGKL